MEMPVIDVAPLVTGAGDRSRVAAEIAQACRDSGFFYVVGHGVDEGLQRRARGIEPPVLCPGPRDEDGHRDGAGRPRVARLLPGWSGADLRQGRCEGRDLFRRRAAGRSPARQGRDAAARREPVSARHAGAPQGGARVHGRDDTARPRTDGRHRLEPRSCRVLLRRSLHAGAAHAVSHLQLSRRSRGVGRRAAMGCRRAHRLRAADDPQTGRHRRAGGEVRRRLDSGSADSRRVSLQHRRHARPHDGRPVQVDASPRAERDATRPALVSVLLRPELRRHNQADRQGRRDARD